MTDEMLHTLLTLISPLITIIFSYGFIRADIKNMHEKFGSIKEDINRVENTASKAHERIDAHVTAYHRGQ